MHMFRGVLMHIADVFNNGKWDIIKDLSDKKLSPLQLAQKYNTTIGNVGNQLRILEAFGLVKKEKVSNRDRGKPRTLFSLAYDCAFLASASKGFANRKLLKMSGYHDTILKLWYIDNEKLHYPLEKFYWKVEDYLSEMKGLAVKVNHDREISVLILTSNIGQLKNKIGNSIQISDENKVPIQFNIIYKNVSELKKFDSVKEYHVIHDPEDFLSSYKESFE